MSDSMKRRTVRYRKIGGGSLRWNNRVIKPNQVFSAIPEELPTAFRSHLVAVDPEPEEEVITPEQTLAIEEATEPASSDSERGYRMLHKRSGWYDIVNTVSGKKINEKSLRKSDAEEMLKELIV